MEEASLAQLLHDNRYVPYEGKMSEDDALSGRTETQSKFGRVITTTTSSGTVNGFFDAYGRVFYSEKGWPKR